MGGVQSVPFLARYYLFSSQPLPGCEPKIKPLNYPLPQEARGIAFEAPLTKFWKNICQDRQYL